MELSNRVFTIPIRKYDKTIETDYFLHTRYLSIQTIIQGRQISSAIRYQCFIMCFSVWEYVGNLEGETSFRLIKNDDFAFLIFDEQYGHLNTAVSCVSCYSEDVPSRILDSYFIYVAIH